MILAVVAGLLVAAENQDGEIDAETDEDRAEPDRHEIQLVKNQEANGQRDDAAKEQTQAHSQQRQPAPETRVKNPANQHNRAD